MKNPKHFLTLSAIIFQFLTVAQNINQRWYFGAYAGLDFSTSPPTVLTDNMQGQLEGCATICDVSGNLLFYTEGTMIRNKQHAAMPNGFMLMGNPSATQAALIVQKPGSSNLYYVFSVDVSTTGQGVSGLHYSVVDMSLAAGLGSVTAKNVLLDSTTTEKVCAVRHCNGQDIWIVAHDWHNFDYTSFLLTSSGISTTAVVSSSVGMSPPYIDSWNFQTGCMKASPDGTKLAACRGDYVDLCDFNGATGQVSNALSLGKVQTGVYGCEFSPDGGKLYASEPYSTTNNSLYQWDLCAGSDAAMLASKTIISSGNSFALGTLQRAIDGKIYLACVNQNALGVINNPNNAGAACNFVINGQTIAPKSCYYGLQNVINDFITTTPAQCIGNRDCNTVSIKELNTNKTSIQIGPNPATDKIQLETNIQGKLTILSQFGSIVYESEIEKSTTEIDISFLPAGIYFMNLVSDQKSTVYRIIKSE